MLLDDHRCALERVQLIWAEAVRSKSATIFAAKKCDNLNAFKNDQCQQTFAYLNPLVSKDLRGDFYLETDANAARDGPFNKGSIQASRDL